VEVSKRPSANPKLSEERQLRGRHGHCAARPRHSCSGSW